MKKVHTHYDNLKVARNAPQEVIRAAYKTLSQKYHPDRNQNSQESHRVMKIINESYGVLSDPQKRALHDQWIAEQEGASNETKSTASKNEQVEVPAPISGGCYYDDLSESEKKHIKQRVSGSIKNQYLIQLDGVKLNYLWMLLLSGWFYYVLNDATEYRWSEDTVLWYAGLTLFAGFFLGKNATWIYSWHRKPLKSLLIVTPLYVIKTRFDRLWYWPIWTISDIKATHNYRNGAYQDTSLSLYFDGKQESFTISPESAYQLFLNRLQGYDERFRAALRANDIEYVINNDDFITRKAEQAQSKNKKSGVKSAVGIYTAFMIISGTLFGASYAINLEQPLSPAYKSRPAPTYSQHPKPKPNYVRPSTAPNGAHWPNSASYVSGYKKLHTDGLSSVTIDNSSNNSDVFVKLVALTDKEAYPVRMFFIPAYSKFKVSNISSGRYDIRYRDLSNGGLAKSESFALEETSTYNGTRYSEMTMTLYKVRNGNMQTYDISESEF